MTGVSVGSVGKVRHGQTRLFMALFALICVLCAAAPLLSGMIAGSGETDFNLLRIESLKNGLANGVFPVRINAEFFGGYGYGASLSVPDVFLYLPALLRLLGAETAFAYNLFLLVCVALTFFTAYLCGRTIAQSRTVGLLAAALTTLSQYYANALYYRACMAEILAFVFMPLVVLGMYALLCGDRDRPGTLFIGMTGLLLSHVPLFLITAAVCAVLCLLFLRRLLKQPGRLVRLLIAALLTAGVTVGFWLPAIEQLAAQPFWIPWLNMDRITATFASLFSPDQQYSEGGFAIPALGGLLLFLCASRIFLRQNRLNEARLSAADRLLATGLLCIWAASRYFPINFWWLFDGLGLPTALQLPAVVLLSVAAALLIDTFSQNRATRTQTVAAVLVVAALTLCLTTAIRPIPYSERAEDYFEDSYYTYPMPQTAILPDGAEYSSFDHPRTVRFDDGDEAPVEKTGTTVTFTVSGENADKTAADVPLLYYTGYEADFVAEDAAENAERVPLELGWEEAAHTVRVQLPGQPGTVCVRYAGTLMQTVSLIISLISSAAAVVLAVIRARRKKTRETV